MPKRRSEHFINLNFFGCFQIFGTPCFGRLLGLPHGSRANCATPSFAGLGATCLCPRYRTRHAQHISMWANFDHKTSTAPRSHASVQILLHGTRDHSPLNNLPRNPDNFLNQHDGHVHIVFSPHSTPFHISKAAFLPLQTSPLDFDTRLLYLYTTPSPSPSPNFETLPFPPSSVCSLLCTSFSPLLFPSLLPFTFRSRSLLYSPLQITTQRDVPSPQSPHCKH